MPGYEAKFVHPLLKRHECPICLYAMRNPVQTECGHLFCRECLNPVLRKRRPICPLDKEEITQDGIFPDNACRKEILNLEVYCNYVAGGCQWVGHLKDLEAHLKTCEHRELQCTQCGEYVLAVSLKAHQEVECPMRPEKCAYCHQEVPSQQMEDHVKKVCPDVLRKCPNGCNSKLEFKLPELQRHLAVTGGNCPLSEVPCPYSMYGCSFVSLRKNLSTHMDQYQAYHVQLQGECFMDMKSAMEKSASTVQHLMERVGSLESRTNAIERLQDAIEQRVGQLDERRDRHLERPEDPPDNSHKLVGDVKRAFQDLSLPWDIAQLAFSFTSHEDIMAAFLQSNVPDDETYMYSSFLRFLFQRISWNDWRSVSVLEDFLLQIISKIPDVEREALGHLYSLVDSLLANITPPHIYQQQCDERQQNISRFSPVMFHNNRSASPESMQSASSHKEESPGVGRGEPSLQRVDALQSRVVEVEHGIDRALSSSLDQELRIQLLERATYNGVLIWKIDEFERRRREAKDGVTMSLYSSPFYTSRHGYKMCCRIYLNGDGLGRSTHLSFFFVIMRGPFDALLQWPFNQKVTLTLFNQSDLKRSVTDSFRPDATSSSFQRPLRREMNIASGCPMFIKLTHLMSGGFVKDDCIYVRAVVDVTDLPKYP